MSSIPITSLPDSSLLQESSIVALEEFITLQSRTPSVYNPRCSRAVLRLYGMYPSRSKRDIILQILAKVGPTRTWRGCLSFFLDAAKPTRCGKSGRFFVSVSITITAFLPLLLCSFSLLYLQSMTAFPDPDFNGALCLVPPSNLSDASFSNLVALERALQQGQFEAFWALSKAGVGSSASSSASAASSSSPITLVVGWREAMQRVVLRVLNSIYATVDVAKLASFLDLVRVYGWKGGGSTREEERVHSMRR